MAQCEWCAAAAVWTITYLVGNHLDRMACCEICTAAIIRCNAVGHPQLERIEE